MMNKLEIIELLDMEYSSLPLHEVVENPFQNLIATLLSQRARDDQIIPIVKKLFQKVKTPEDILKLPHQSLKKIIKSAGKYRQNTIRIKQICTILIKHYKSKVPNNEKELLLLPGVGRKTANIVLAQSFNKDAIAVDVHVHRIVNRLGWIKTENPQLTEIKLQKIIPKKYWKMINRIFVSYGQTICTPISPFCSKCKIRQSCKKINVTKTR